MKKRKIKLSKLVLNVLRLKKNDCENVFISRMKKGSLKINNIKLLDYG